MLSEYRKLVYADDRYNDNTLSCAYRKSIFLLLPDFFLKIFYCFCVFVFVFDSFWSYFFFVVVFCESTYCEKQEKEIIYEPVEQRHYSVEVFTDYHVKRAFSLCVI